MKFIPFFFPQFHEIKENNEWWGNGYTDWVKVKEAKPLFENHYQPRTPVNGYYDLSKEETIIEQINLALQYNIHGFSFYHYWFDGKLLLEKPLENFLKHNTTLKFCVTWANETWTKRWVGKVNDVLIEQKHTPDSNVWKQHFDYLLQFFCNKNYIRIDNKPVFIIYRPDIIVDLKKWMHFFDMEAKQNGFEGLFFVAAKSYEVYFNNNLNSFDAVLKFQPREIMNSNKFKSSSQIYTEKLLRSLPEKMQIIIGEIKAKFNSYKILSYDFMWQKIIEGANQQEVDTKVFQTAVVDWDNTPRYGNRAKIFDGATPEKFQKYLHQLNNIESQKGIEYIFINAWNEWSEGAYLEPDKKWGSKYLEVLKKESL